RLRFAPPADRHVWEGLAMWRGNKWKALAIGLIPFALIAAWLSHPHFGGNRPPKTEDHATILKGHTLPVQALAISPDGNTLTSVAYFVCAKTGVEVRDWDVQTGTPKAERTASLSPFRSVAFAPGSRTLAAAGGDQGVWLWDPDAPNEWRRLVEHRLAVN